MSIFKIVKNCTDYGINCTNTQVHVFFTNTSALSTFNINPSPAKFLKWNNPPSIFGPRHYHFWEYQDENFRLVSQQCSAWSDCTNVEAGL